MRVLVDTSAWSLALRRDQSPEQREVRVLAELVERGENLVLIGAILQEVLQGFVGGTRFRRLVEILEAFPLLDLGREDFIYAAELRNSCRAKGVQVTTVDAQIAAAAIRHECGLLSADDGFRHVARLFPLVMV